MFQIMYQCIFPYFLHGRRTHDLSNFSCNTRVVGLAWVDGREVILTIKPKLLLFTLIFTITFELLTCALHWDHEHLAGDIFSFFISHSNRNWKGDGQASEGMTKDKMKERCRTTGMVQVIVILMARKQKCIFL